MRLHSGKCNKYRTARSRGSREHRGAGEPCPVEALTGFSGALASGIVLKVERSCFERQDVEKVLPEWG